MAKKTKIDRPYKSYYEKAREEGVILRDRLRGESSSAEDFACAPRTAGMVLLAEADRMDPPRRRTKREKPDPDPTNGEGGPAWDDIDPAHENN